MPGMGTNEATGALGDVAGRISVRRDENANEPKHCTRVAEVSVMAVENRSPRPD